MVKFKLFLKSVKFGTVDAKNHFKGQGYS